MSQDDTQPIRLPSEPRVTECYYGVHKEPRVCEGEIPLCGACKEYVRRLKKLGTNSIRSIRAEKAEQIQTWDLGSVSWVAP